MGPVEDSKDMETDEMENVYVTGTSDSISTNRNIYDFPINTDLILQKIYKITGRN